MNITALHPLAYALAANGAYARFSDEPSLATTHACTLLEDRGRAWPGRRRGGRSTRIAGDAHEPAGTSGVKIHVAGVCADAT